PTLPSIPIPTPLPPPPPSAPRTTPDGRPIAAAIPSGADPCEVPLEYEVDCDREWEQREPETCESRGREMILVGSYGTGGPVVVEVARTAAPIVLVLHSYTATEWQLRLADGARLERVVAAGYMMGRVTGAPPGVPVETHDRSDGWP